MQRCQEDVEGGQHPTHQGKTAQGVYVLQHPVHVVTSVYIDGSLII